MNRSEIRTRILESLNESASSPVFYSTAQIDTVIDEAAEVLAEEAGAIRRSAFTPLREGTTYYYSQGIATDMMAPYRIWITNLNRRLLAVSVKELDERNERWIDTDGDPEYWFPLSWNLFGIYPHPSAAGGVMRVDYLAWPRALLDDSDEPEYRRADHDAFVLYGVYEGLMKEWNMAKAAELFNRFMERWSDTRARSGIREIQARALRAATVEAAPWRSGVQR